MSDEQRLRDALSGLVPEPPTVPERASAARAHAARARRGRIAAGAGAAPVAAAIVVPFALAGDSDRADNGPGPATSPSPGVAAGQFDCPPPDDDDLAPAGSLDGPDGLPDGAIAARLCFDGGVPWQAPHDPLTQHVDQIVAQVNGLPKQSGGNGCPADLGPTWAMLFQYADGHTQLIRGRTFGCGGVDVGDVTRGDRDTDDDPLHRFQDLLWQQREQATPSPVGDRQPACDHTFFDDGPGLTMMTWPHPLQLSRGVACWQYATHSAQPLNSAPLSPDLAILVADFNEHVNDGNSPDQGCTQVITVALDAITGWDDELRMDSSCGTFFVYDGEQQRWWRPDQQSQAILDRLISTGQLEIPLPGAETAPDEVVNAWVDLFNNDRPERAGQLWVGDQPTLSGVDRIELKIIDVVTVDAAPGTPESAYQAVRSVTASYREVPVDADFRERTFTLVRNSTDEPWRILSYDDQGAAQTGR